MTEAPTNRKISSPTTRALRVVVAGAGALGLTCAVLLARKGAAVTLCDPAPLGDNASGVAAGMLAPAFETILDPLSARHFDLLCAARNAWPAFAASIGLPLERDGALWAGADPAGIEARLIAAGAMARRLSAAEAQRALPGLAMEGEAVFTAEDWRLDVGIAFLALGQAAQAAGVRIAAASVADFSPGEARLSDGAAVPADRLVVATGAQAAHLAPELVALSPIKGHILRMVGGPVAGPVVRAEGVYVRPQLSGAVVGATMEGGLDDRTIDPDIAAGLAARASTLFPSLAGARYLAAAGVRATTTDGLPLVGQSDRPCVLLAAGARRNGWLLAPKIAEIIAVAAFGEPMPEHAAALDPLRFG